MLETDYLIIGCGASGMAFADVILTETNFRILIVDKFDKPGGHWNHAYPFVTLHQPSLFYGVSSSELGNRNKIQVGLNKGLNEQASAAEISAYYNNVMSNQFLPSGRVQYFPLCTYQGNGRFESLLTGETHNVVIKKKIFDSTYLNTQVPSCHKPNFKIESKVNFIPPNDLPKISKKPSGFVIIGGGKTSMDACLWLLKNSVAPDRITWIVPRDAWFVDREHVQPTAEFIESFITNQANRFEALAEASSITDLFDKLESKGVLLRLDKNFRPTMYRCASVSKLELEQLRRIKNVIRKGRVKNIGLNQILLDYGSIPTNGNQIHVDCSASGVSRLLEKPIFSGNTILSQTVRPCQSVFSAAFIGYIEVTFEDEDKKNELCTVVPLPLNDVDWLTMLASSMKNSYNWNRYESITRWLYNNRLDGFSKVLADISKEDKKKQMILKRLKNNIRPAMIKLRRFIYELEKSHANN